MGEMLSPALGPLYLYLNFHPSGNTGNWSWQLFNSGNERIYCGKELPSKLPTIIDLSIFTNYALTYATTHLLSASFKPASGSVQQARRSRRSKRSSESDSSTTILRKISERS